MEALLSLILQDVLEAIGAKIEVRRKLSLAHDELFGEPPDLYDRLPFSAILGKCRLRGNIIVTPKSKEGYRLTIEPTTWEIVE